MVSHMFDKILYSTTFGSPWIQWDQKMPPCISKYVNKHSFQSKNFIMPVHFCIWYHLPFEQNIYITLHLCGVGYLYRTRRVALSVAIFSVK